MTVGNTTRCVCILGILLISLCLTLIVQFVNILNTGDRSSSRIMEFVNSSADMSPNIAKYLFKTGATLILAGVPVATEFGIDLSSYEVGERFRGVKMIPTGPHYVFCAAKDVYGSSAPRVGFMHYFKSEEIVIREWDRQKEELRFRQSDDSELERQRIRENLENLDRFLAPYDYKELPKWKSLTDTITEEVLDRCKPECGFIRNSMEFQSCSDSDRPRGEPSIDYKHKINATDESDFLPNLKPIPATALKFVEVPPRVPKEATPAEVTKHNLDCSDAVNMFLSSFSKPEEVMQEIQLSFVFFCCGYSIDGLSHWRKILNILSNSETAVCKFELFYMKYLEVLQNQLPELPEELMVQTEQNTVYRDVKSLLRNCWIAGLSVSVDRVIKRLAKSMKWTFTGLLDEDPEDMPVIVSDEN